MASGPRRPSRPRPVPPALLLDALVAVCRRAHTLRTSPLGRRAARRRAVAVVVAGAVALAVAHQTAAARTVLEQWGPTAPVLVAAVPLPAGAELGPGVVRTERWPARLVPGTALTSVVGRRTARAVAEGVPLTTADLAGTGRGAVAARLPAGTVGVTVPRGAAPAPLRTGDRVDVLGAAADGRSLGARRVAVRATVVAVDRVSATVAVRRDEAEDVAAAGAGSTAVLVLVP